MASNVINVILNLVAKTLIKEVVYCVVPTDACSRITGIGGKPLHYSINVGMIKRQLVA